MDMRIVTRISPDGAKTVIKMKELVAGDIFTIKESDSEPIGGVWHAVADASLSEDGVWGVVADVLADDVKAKLPALVHE